MNIFVAAPCSFADSCFARLIRAPIKQCIKPFFAALILMFAGNAYAVITVGLAIENDLDSNGNITVINGSKVKVSYEVLEDTDKDLNKKDRIELRTVDGDELVSFVVRGKKNSGSVSLKVKNSEGEQLYVRYVRKSGTQIARTSHPDDAGTPLVSIAKASLADLTVGLNALTTPQAGQVIALPNTCIAAEARVPLHDNMNSITPPSNSWGPGIAPISTAANSDLRLFCPIPLQVPPGADVFITGADFLHYDGSPNCRVEGQIRFKTFGTASNGVSVSTVHSGASVSDFAFVGSGSIQGNKAFPTFPPLAISSSTIAWVYVLIDHNSTSGGECRYMGSLVDYTVSRP